MGCSCFRRFNTVSNHIFIFFISRGLAGLPTFFPLPFKNLCYTMVLDNSFFFLNQPSIRLGYLTCFNRKNHWVLSDILTMPVTKKWICVYWSVVIELRFWNNSWQKNTTMYLENLQNKTITTLRIDSTAILSITLVGGTVTLG